MSLFYKVMIPATVVVLGFFGYELSSASHKDLFPKQECTYQQPLSKRQEEVPSPLQKENLRQALSQTKRKIPLEQRVEEVFSKSPENKISISDPLRGIEKPSLYQKIWSTIEEQTPVHIHVKTWEETIDFYLRLKGYTIARDLTLISYENPEEISLLAKVYLQELQQDFKNPNNQVRGLVAAVTNLVERYNPYYPSQKEEELERVITMYLREIDLLVLDHQENSKVVTEVESLAGVLRERNPFADNVKPYITSMLFSYGCSIPEEF